MEPVPSPRPLKTGLGIGCLIGGMFGLQLLILFLAAAFGDGLLGMIGGSIFCLPLSLLLLAAATRAAQQKRWLLAVVALLLALPVLLLFRLLF